VRGREGESEDEVKREQEERWKAKEG